ncbi:unnamed protein product, partial [Mycena citricolor]
IDPTRQPHGNEETGADTLFRAHSGRYHASSVSSFLISVCCTNVRYGMRSTKPSEKPR